MSENFLNTSMASAIVISFALSVKYYSQIKPLKKPFSYIEKLRFKS